MCLHSLGDIKVPAYANAIKKEGSLFESFGGCFVVCFVVFFSFGLM